MLDILGHIIFGLAILAPAAKGQVWASAVLLGLFREAEQMRLAGDWSLGINRLVDVAGWLVAGLILQWWVKP